MFDFEDAQREIIDICESLYGSIDHNRYFMSHNDTVFNVRQSIMEKMKTEDLKKNIYLDMSVYILQVGDDVFILLS